jgi:hypothetical protein
MLVCCQHERLCIPRYPSSAIMLVELPSFLHSTHPEWPSISHHVGANANDSVSLSAIHPLPWLLTHVLLAALLQTLCSWYVHASNPLTNFFGWPLEWSRGMQNRSEETRLSNKQRNPQIELPRDFMSSIPYYLCRVQNKWQMEIVSNPF